MILILAQDWRECEGCLRWRSHDPWLSPTNSQLASPKRRGRETT